MRPIDVPDLAAWATSAQAAVNAIRAAGATSQYILLPGEYLSNFDSSGHFSLFTRL